MTLYKCSKCGGTKYYTSWYTKKGMKKKYLNKNCRSCTLEAQKKYNNTPHGKAAITLLQRKNHLKQYGLTPESYQEMVDAQNGVCWICQKPEKNGNNLSVDHCHDSGQIRGLLCRGCNMGIAGLKHDKNLLLVAIRYLKQD